MYQGYYRDFTFTTVMGGLCLLLILWVISVIQGRLKPNNTDVPDVSLIIVILIILSLFIR